MSLLGGSTAVAFPKEAMRVALVADALDRKASKKRKRELRDAPPPPEDAPPDDEPADEKPAREPRGTVP